MFNYHVIIAVQMVTEAIIALALVSIAISLRKRNK
jgi:hypothetical protein